MRRNTSRSGRVVASHEIARAAFLAALGFAIVAVAWSVYVLAVGGPWWGPLHAFLAGTVLLAISGASQMFTITWSSTVPPRRVISSTQRWLLIAGVGLGLVGVGLDVPGLVWLGGAAAVAGVAMLGWVVYSAVRKSLNRRFDLSARFYLTAFAAGAIGITLGTLMGTGVIGDLLTSARLVHAHINLMGLVGLTIIGTIPTLLPTTAYSPAVSGREAVVAWWMALGGSAGIAIGVLVPRMVGVGTLLIASAGGFILAGILLRLWAKGRHKTAFLQISAGTTWLIAWAAADGISVAVEGTMTHFSGWTAAVVLAGVGQVLAGSLVYLVPVLKGSPFVANRRIMEARPWLSLISVNTAGLCLGLGAPVAAVVFGFVWLGDFAVRLARVIAGRGRDEPAGDQVDPGTQ